MPNGESDRRWWRRGVGSTERWRRGAGRLNGWRGGAGGAGRAVRVDTDSCAMGEVCFDRKRGSATRLPVATNGRRLSGRLLRHLASERLVDGPVCGATRCVAGKTCCNSSCGICGGPERGLHEADLRAGPPAAARAWIDADCRVVGRLLHGLRLPRARPPASHWRPALGRACAASGDPCTGAKAACVNGALRRQPMRRLLFIGRRPGCWAAGACEIRRAESTTAAIQRHLPASQRRHRDGLPVRELHHKIRQSQLARGSGSPDSARPGGACAVRVRQGGVPGVRPLLRRPARRRQPAPCGTESWSTVKVTTEPTFDRRLLRAAGTALPYGSLPDRHPRLSDARRRHGPHARAHGEPTSSCRCRATSWTSSSASRR